MELVDHFNAIVGWSGLMFGYGGESIGAVLEPDCSISINHAVMDDKVTKQ
ncbi:hypothetical protein [Endozoicomonas sp. Mp262]